MKDETSSHVANVGEDEIDGTVDGDAVGRGMAWNSCSSFRKLIIAQPSASPTSMYVLTLWL